jgi:autophagy-related protein 9
MMASNLLSRLLPTNNNAPSIYEDLRAHEEASEQSDVEERVGMALDEENLGGSFHDYNLQNAEVFNGEESRITTESMAFLPEQQQGQQPRRQPGNQQRDTRGGSRSKWVAQSPRILEDDGDDDVPASLLIEGDEDAGPSQPTTQRDTRSKRQTKASAVPGPPTREARARWDRAQEQQRLHQDDDLNRPRAPVPKSGLVAGSPREKAMWTWLNATNLDHFMGEVYDYYVGSGIWCICLERFLSLL